MNPIFVLNGSTGNRGCEAILLSTWELWRQAYPRATSINSSMIDPRIGRTAYLNKPGLKHRCHPEPGSVQFLKWQLSKRLGGKTYNFERFLPRSDLVMSLGGDNYSLDYGSATKYLNANDKVLASGKPLVIWGASIGPFSDDPKLEARVAEQFRNLACVVARERRTVAYLSSIGIQENVVLLPDPAFSLEKVPCLLSEQQQEILGRGAIGLNLSPLLARYRTEPDSWVEDAASWVKALLASTDRPIVLIPHVFEPGNDDQSFLSEVKTLVGAPEESLCLINGRRLSSMQLKYVISQLHLFIGARTHATIAAMSQHVPTISIGYSVKAMGINEEVYGSSDWVISHKGLDGDKLARCVAKLDSQSEKVRKELRKKMMHYSIKIEDIQRVLTRVPV